MVVNLINIEFVQVIFICRDFLLKPYCTFWYFHTKALHFLSCRRQCTKCPRLTGHTECFSCSWFASCSSSRSIRFKEHLNSNEPEEVLSTEEYEELRASCRQSQKAERAEQSQEEAQEGPPGEEKPVTPEGLDTVRNKETKSGLLGFKLAWFLWKNSARCF